MKANSTPNLKTLPAGGSSAAYAINDLDEVAGETLAPGGQYHAFWKSAGSGKDEGFVDLGVLSGHLTSCALGINRGGRIVGWSQANDPSTQKAVIWYNDGAMVDLITKVSNPSGWTLRSAEAVNDGGKIVGWGLKNSIEAAFLLTPN
ncbi:MAG TPA: hypothetical protein VJA21_09610 [Verrucomicrobiae bacterium]